MCILGWSTQPSQLLVWRHFYTGQPAPCDYWLKHRQVDTWPRLEQSFSRVQTQECWFFSVAAPENDWRHPCSHSTQHYKLFIKQLWSGYLHLQSSLIYVFLIQYSADGSKVFLWKGSFSNWYKGTIWATGRAGDPYVICPPWPRESQSRERGA